jgi:hypothetical protein
VNREQQEMALWRRVFERWYAREGYEVDTCGGTADAAVAEFRKRYPAEPEPPEPTAPEPTWYDVPPFAKDGKSHACWVVGEEYPCATLWSHFALPAQWVYSTTENEKLVPINGRRVSPIIKPQEPTK